MARHNRKTYSADPEEARLLTSLVACNDRLMAALRVLSEPMHSTLMTEKMNFGNDVEMAHAECMKAITALRKYRESRRRAADEDSK